MEKAIGFLAVLFFSLLLSGCAGANREVAKQPVYKSDIQSVQTAVDDFQKKTGVLPIKTRDSKTPHYLRNPIKFSKLVPDYLPNPPKNAYVAGGTYIYVIVNPDRDPTVKLVDVKIVQKVQELQTRLNIFRSEHRFSPLEDIIVKKRYTLRYDRLGYSHPPVVKSPFTGNDLGFVIGVDAKVHVDYRKDLYAFMQKYQVDSKPAEDIRPILVNHSPFVPVYSFPYTAKNGEPVFLVK